MEMLAVSIIGYSNLFFDTPVIGNFNPEFTEGWDYIAMQPMQFPGFSTVS